MIRKRHRKESNRRETKEKKRLPRTIEERTNKTETIDADIDIETAFNANDAKGSITIEDATYLDPKNG